MYTVEFKDIPDDAICFLPISVGQGYHEGEKFEATLKAVNQSFKECVILIGDTLQRHTIMMDGLTDNEQEALDKAVQLGEDWYKQAEDKINSIITIPKTVVRWDDLTAHEAQQKQKEVFKERIDQVANNISTGALHFTTARNKRAKKTSNQLVVIDAKKAFMHSEAYIREELTKFLCLKEWPQRKDFKTKSVSGMRPIHFCYPFKGNQVAECVIDGLKTLLGNDPNIIFTNIQITGEPRPVKKTQQKNQQESKVQTSSRAHANGSPSFFRENRSNSTSRTPSPPSPPSSQNGSGLTSPTGSPPKNEDLVGAFLDRIVNGLLGNPAVTLTDQQAESIAKVASNLQWHQGNQYAELIDVDVFERSPILTN